VIEDGVIWFAQTNLGWGEEEVREVGLSLRYWAAYNDYEVSERNNQMDGAYIFRPVLDMYDSAIYSRPTKVEVHQCDVT